MADPSKVEVIDPLAGPWTVRRSRKRGRRRLAKKPSFSGGLASNEGPAGRPGATATATVAALDLQTELDALTELDDEIELELHTEHEDEVQDAPDPRSDATGASSYLDAKPPHLIGSPRTRHPARGWWKRYRVAAPVLALLIVAGLALTSAVVGLVKAGISAATGAPAASVLLAVPAPESAGGLPRHDPPVHNAAVQQLIAEFMSRFAAVRSSSSGQPAALYREPGAVDPATGEPGWVMYLGQSSAATLGAPGVTISRVMTALTRSSAPGSSWRVATGPLGGSAQCAIAPFGTTTVSLCAWATAHTIGALMSPAADTRGNELAVLMPLMRVDLQPG